MSLSAKSGFEKYIHIVYVSFCERVLAGTSEGSKTLKPDKTLDVLGFFCPEPIFRTRMEIDKMNRDEVLEVLADDPAAESDITSWARKTGQEMLSVEKNGSTIRFLIRKTK